MSSKLIAAPQVELSRLTQAPQIDLGIDPRSVHAAMAEMVGDLLQSESSIQKLARTCVPQAMCTALVQLHALLGQPRSHHAGDARARQRPDWRLDRQEQSSVSAARTCPTEVVQDSFTNRHRHWITLHSAHLRP